MKTKERIHYSRGSQPVFDKIYDRLKQESVILNLDNRANSISHYGSDDDLGFLERMRSAWQGNDQGLHRTPNDNNWRTSRIPAIQEKLQELNEKFLQYQQQKINSGFERPESMPVEMHDRQMELQARLSLAQTELDYILEHIEKITSVVKEKDDSMVLKYGMRQTGQLHASVLVELDYQAISTNAKGQLVIDDSRSPYSGMLVVDYRKLATRWDKARMILNRERDKIFHGLKGKQLSDDQRTAWDLRYKELIEQHPDWPDLFGLKLQGKPAIPIWPADVKNHLEQGKPTAPITRSRPEQRKSKVPISKKSK